MSTPITPSPATEIPPEPPPGESVSISQKMCWGIGGVADNLIANGIVSLALPIYNIGLGVNAVLLGWAMALPRGLDAFIDTWVGNLSDNTRSRWGRRRPFILAGGLLSGLTFMLLWAPPIRFIGLSWLGHPAVFWHFLVISMIYFFGYAFYLIPYNALGYELSTDYHERTRIQAWKFFFLVSAGFLLPWLYRFSLYMGERFPVSGLRAEVAGVRYVGLMVGVLILIASVLPAIFSRENQHVQAQEKIRFRPALKLTLANPVFLVFCMIIFLVQASLFLVSPFALYMTIYYICDGDKVFASLLGGYAGTLNAVLGLLVTWPVTWLATHYGKKETLRAGTAVALVGNLATWFLFTPHHPYWMLLTQIIMCPGLTCVYVLTGSMLADICDYDELRSGLRREGMYGAMFAFLFKGGNAIVTLISGYMLAFAGYVENLTPSAETLFRMRLLFALVPAVGIALALGLMIFYPINEQSMRRVRAELNARKVREMTAGRGHVQPVAGGAE